jgi:hypothetical protein
VEEGSVVCADEVDQDEEGKEELDEGDEGEYELPLEVEAVSGAENDRGEQNGEMSLHMAHGWKEGAGSVRRNAGHVVVRGGVYWNQGRQKTQVNLFQLINL